MLSYKIAALLALCSAQRSQTLAALDLDHMIDNGNMISFNITSLLKTSQPGKQVHNIEFQKYSNKKFCVVNTIHEYVL